ncbi:MAG: hypothetical protein P4L41_17080 [Flavipsychrobacter sp.]|nr:hypothetical protein [Flavipsychrobacter sp.]
MKHLCATLLLFLSLYTIPVYAQIESNKQVIVLPINIQVPANAKKLATIKLGNNNTQVHCVYDELVAQIKARAAAAGGNLVKIKKLISPYFVGSCYKIEAEIYSCLPLPQYDIKEDGKPAMITQLGDTSKYALLYVYRLQDTLTFQPGYNLYMNDSLLCHVKSKSKNAIKIYQPGKVTLSAETEQRVSVTLDMSLAHVYFLRCGTTSGSLRPIPFMEQVSFNTGLSEYQSLIKTKKDVDVSYLNQIH